MASLFYGIIFLSISSFSFPLTRRRTKNPTINK
jgi:hypothetical protein